MKRDEKEYIRLLELQAVISEEWGEIVKEINDYLWKGNDVVHLERAEKELQRIVSPIRELEGFIDLEKRKKDIKAI